MAYSGRNRKINFNEPIPQMIERLTREHRSFESKLEEVEHSVNINNDSGYAAQIIRNMSESVIHHAVEEEARLMRVIMQKAKQESAESIKIMQEHNWVMNFLKNRLTGIEKTVKFDSETQPQQQHDEEQTKKELIEFVTNLREHFLEEEQIVFPLVLKANLLQ
ncbi:MAG TPA: hemerythrin domain-containing protein [Nitrososphaeraceae archaeon]|jgi:iron-sulfur cluster repair protein YtfE (RIC family)